MNLCTYLLRAAARYGDAPALMHGTEVIADYRAFADRVIRLSAGLVSSMGLRPGGRVVLAMGNCTEYLELLYAVWHAGGVVVPVNYKLHVREVAWICTDASACFAVCDPKMQAGLRQAVDEAGGDCPVIAVGEDAYRALSATSAPVSQDPVPRAVTDLGWIFYTSGTTGKPKGVMLTIANLQAMIMGYLADVDAVSAADATVYAAPISHGAGLYNFMFVIKGARHVVPVSGGFDAQELLDLSAALGSAHFFAAPTMIVRLTAAARACGSRGNGIRTIVYGGGPMYLADLTEALDVFGPKFVQIYGQGESPMTITTLARDTIAARSDPRWQARAGSVGLPHSCVELRVVDAEGEAVPPDVPGEIMVRGLMVMDGYWNTPEATSKTLKDGWLATGDVGRLDADGYLTLVDRSKDVIISGGTNIYPKEIEDVLSTHPAVRSVSVLGEPDPEWGENVVAFVELHDGAEVTDQALDAHCLDHLARFKRPKKFYRMDRLPVSENGKILKRELRCLLPG